MVCQPDGDNDSAEAWQTVAEAEATMPAAMTLVSNAAAMLTPGQQSAANDGPVGRDVKFDVSGEPPIIW